MPKEVQVYSTKGFFPAPNIDRNSYVALMKAREAACKDFVKSAQDSLPDILKIIDLEEFAGKKYMVEVGTVPNCELLAVWDSPIPHIRVEYAIDTPEYIERKNPIFDLREKRKSERTGAYKTVINYNGSDIPIIVTTKREGAIVRRNKPELITPDSIHELFHATRSDLDSIGNGYLLAELFAQQFDVEERMAALYEGLRDARPKPYVRYYPQFNPDFSARDITITFPTSGIRLEQLGDRPTQIIRNKFQSEICEQHPDYKKTKELLGNLVITLCNGIIFYIPEYRNVFFVRPKGNPIERKIVVDEAKEILRTENSLTQIADSLGYMHTKFLRVISRLTYFEVNVVSDRLYKGTSLDNAITETVQPWRMNMFEDLLARDDEVQLVKAPRHIDEDQLLLFHAMTKKPLNKEDFNRFLASAGLK